MFERLMRRGERIATEAARRRRDALGGALRDTLPAEIAVEAREEGVLLTGRGLRRRSVLDPRLRWLLARLG